MIINNAIFNRALEVSIKFQWPSFQRSWTDHYSNESSRPQEPRDGLHLNSDSDEWEELTATEGEELNPDCGLHDSKKGELVASTPSEFSDLSDGRTYRSGVVGAARSTYQNRKIHLLRWITRSDFDPKMKNWKPDPVDTEPPNAQSSVSHVAEQPASAFAFLLPGKMGLEDYGMLFVFRCPILVRLDYNFLLAYPEVRNSLRGPPPPQKTDYVASFQTLFIDDRSFPSAMNDIDSIYAPNAHSNKTNKLLFS